jgi:hypothetical protein
VDHEKAVKRYRRSAAGDPEPMPCDVRPPSVLVVRINLFDFSSQSSRCNLFVENPRLSLSYCD